MATSKVSVTEGSGKNLATHSLSEDAVTKEISRVNLNDSAGADILGSKTDAKSTATDTTAVSAISIWKQISASVQSLVTNAVSAGRAAITASLPVIHAGYQYETVAASQTDQALGGTGAAGDLLWGVLIVPATTGAGTVSIKDGAGSAINIFVTGTLSNLVPFFVPLNLVSASGAWKITTGANVSAIGIGDFTA